MGLGGKDEEYGKRLGKACCSYGSMNQNLNIPKDHGVYFQDNDHPFMNANDHVGNQHLLQFGRCTSPANPGNASAMAAGMVFPVLAPILLMARLAKKAMGCSGCKCVPITLTSWKEGDKCNKLDGAPAIVTNSQCLCAYGGLITMTEDDPPKDGNNQNSEQEEKKQTDILDTIPPEMADKIRDMNATPGMAQDAASFYESGAGTGAAASCSPATSIQNSISNSSQIPSMASMNDAGYLVNQEELGNFNIASTSLATMGSCAMASYNTLKTLDMNKSLPDVITMIEGCQTIQGIVDVGPTAVNLMTMSTCMKRCGLETAVMPITDFRNTVKDMGIGEACVIARTCSSLLPGEKEFLTCKKTATGLSCMENMAINPTELIESVNSNYTMMMRVAKKDRV